MTQLVSMQLISIANDAVNLDLAADGANNDNRSYLNVPTNQRQHIPYEMGKDPLPCNFSIRLFMTQS